METILIILFLIISSNDSFYKNIKTIYSPTEYDYIVNKNIKLEKTYKPLDLEAIDTNYALENKYLRKEAKYQFEKMARDAKDNNLTIIAVSAFRDYNYQEKLFNNYVKNKGEYYALLCSAKAGHSEHQTGLSVDISDSTYDYDNFEYTKEFKWVSKNAHKYGFILRYPKAKYHITGFKYEPWHYRYVGIDIASTIYQKKITLEEYKNI